MTALVLSSPRTRRRLAWLAGVVVAVGAIAAASALLPSRNPVLEATDAPAVATPAGRAQPARAYVEPKTVPAPRKELNALLDAFIPAVVARKDLAGGWNLVTADARGSRAEWMRGTTPYPQATFQPAGKKSFVWADTDLQPQAVGSAANEGRLSAAWLLFPVAIVGLALVGGLGFGVVRGLRRRARVKRIERELALTR